MRLYGPCGSDLSEAFDLGFGSEAKIKPKSKATASDKSVRPTHAKSDIQILYIQRVLFDELSTRLDIFTHEGGEDGFALSQVFKLHGK
jgi:hypothetical protein